MRLIRGLHNLSYSQSALSQGCVVTIGNFDGVHIGHQRVLDEVKRLAAQRNLPSVVMVFEPFPVEFFSPQEAPVRLMNLREKLHAFERSGVDYVVCVAFNSPFAQLTAQDFITQVLQQGLNARHVVVGDDFRFGSQRQGDFALLQTEGEKRGFSVSAMPTFIVGGERVSSTRIRDLLSLPDLEQANRLLGHDFRFEGRVIHGQKLGRTLGFPTLNLNPKRLQMPVNGVFSVRVAGLSKYTPTGIEAWPGVANIGVRPTVQGKRPSIEVHLFDWQASVYGAHVEVRLETFIRPEMKFNGLSELQAQIAQDAAQARHFLNL